MSASDDLRRKARSDYVYRRMTLATIAVAYGKSEATLGRWKKSAREAGDDWDKARTAHVIAGEGVEVVVSSVVEDFMIQAQAILDEIKTGDHTTQEKVAMLVSLSDAMTKMAASAKRFAPKVSRGRRRPGRDGEASGLRPSGIPASRHRDPRDHRALRRAPGRDLRDMSARPKLKAALSRKDFRDKIAGMASDFARHIEVNVEAFPADQAARTARLARVEGPDGFLFFMETYLPHYVRGAHSLFHEAIFTRVPEILASDKGARDLFIAPRARRSPPTFRSASRSTASC